MSYRGDRDALVAQIEALRADLKEAERDSRELEVVKAELEDKSKALARLERVYGPRRPVTRGRVVAVMVALGVAGLGVGAWMAMGGRANVGAEDATMWFARVKARCNPVEVEAAMASEKAPSGDAGRGYRAACFALAGKIEESRRVIDGIAPKERWRAAGIVFDLAHPIADAGNDRAAGPIMEMVLHYWPNNYQAEYHAGMAAFGVGDKVRAEQRLSHFVETYRNDDNFRQTAIKTLATMKKE